MSGIIPMSGRVAPPVLLVAALIAALIGVQFFASSAPRPGDDVAGLGIHTILPTTATDRGRLVRPCGYRLTASAHRYLG